MVILYVTYPVWGWVRGRAQGSMGPAKLRFMEFGGQKGPLRSSSTMIPKPSKMAKI